MKVKELSSLSGINPETIRSYRLKGFLFPEKLENGYYDYQTDDFISLAYIRKLRGYSLSLEEIHRMCLTNPSPRLLEVYDRMENAIDQQIHRLQQEKLYLEFERKHFADSSFLPDKEARFMHSIDEKYDFYDLFSGSDPICLHLNELYPRITPTIWISRDILNGTCEDRIIPIRAGIGTYRRILEDLQIPLPENHVILPNGTYISQSVSLTNMHEMNLSELKPMIELAKESGKPFISDLTGYLMHVEIKNRRPVFHFRIRACTEISTENP